MSSSEPYYSDDERRRLLEFVDLALLHGVERDSVPKFDGSQLPEKLREERAVFVTLRKGGRLRGCMGSIIAERELFSDVLNNSYSAGFRDPRFPAVQRDELDAISGSISVLTPMRDIHFSDEADLSKLLRPGIDGVLLRGGGKQATFLPAVWEQLPEPEEFLQKLKAKAGMQDLEGVRAFRYATESFP